jgi:hypothetical protein
VTPELLVKNHLWITNNQQNTVVNFNVDFMASIHSNFFQIQTATASSIHSGETRLSKQEKEETIENNFILTITFAVTSPK